MTKNKKKSKQESIAWRALHQRRMPILIRIAIMAILMVTMLFIGTFIGYCILGDGQFIDLINFSSWQHIKDIVLG